MFNLGLRFLLELVMLAALAISGYSLTSNPFAKWLLAISLPFIAAIVWGLWVAPKSNNILDQPFRLILELVLFSSTVVILFKAGYKEFGLIFGAVVAVNELLIYIWKQ